MQIFKLLNAFLCTALTCIISACNVLVTTDGLTMSHIMFHYRVAETLAKAGMNVTFYHAFSRPDVEIKNPNPLVRIIKHQANHDLNEYKKFTEEETAKAFQNAKMEWSTLEKMKNITISSCEYQLNNAKLAEELRSVKFDLMIGHMTDYCWLAFAHSLNISTFVWMADAMVNDGFAYFLRIPGSPSYIPHFMHAFSDRMNFQERAINLLTNFANPYFMHYFLDDQEAVIKKKMPDFPGFDVMLTKTSLIIANTEEFLEFPKPLFHNILYVGGIGIEDLKPLNEKWLKILENPKYKGTILFSMGSAAKASEIPKQIQIELVKAFKRFPDYQFIMKLDQSIPEAADVQNVYISNWVPQMDLLYHSRMLAFVTHGGWNSVMESARAGVPLVLVPLFGDQYGNMKRAESKGFGIGLHKFNLTEENIHNALHTIIYNSSYRENALRLSRMIRKKPVKPAEILTNWMIFLCEFKRNFSVLRPVATDLSFIEYYLIDVWLILLISALIFLCLFVLFFRFCLKFFYRKSEKIDKKLK